MASRMMLEEGINLFKSGEELSDAAGVISKINEEAYMLVVTDRARPLVSFVVIGEKYSIEYDLNNKRSLVIGEHTHETMSDPRVSIIYSLDDVISIKHDSIYKYTSGNIPELLEVMKKELEEYTKLN